MELAMSLDDSSRDLARKHLPNSAHIRCNSLCIVEWLFDDDQRTGQDLQAWAETKRSGWSRLYTCNGKSDVLEALSSVKSVAIEKGISPIIHFETHGSSDGLEGRGNLGPETLRWAELNEPLQKLNAATNCNLLIFIAACDGFAGIKAFGKGPYAPAAALAGPTAVVSSGELLGITKEFYRQLMLNEPALTTMVENATRESYGCSIEYEPFALLAFESCVQAIRRKIQGKDSSKFGCEHFDLDKLDPRVIQQVWNTMFLIDNCPANSSRFGVDWSAVIAEIRS